MERCGDRCVERCMDKALSWKHIFINVGRGFGCVCGIRQGREVDHDDRSDG